MTPPEPPPPCATPATSPSPLPGTTPKARPEAAPGTPFDVAPGAPFEAAPGNPPGAAPGAPVSGDPFGPVPGTLHEPASGGPSASSATGNPPGGSAPHPARHKGGAASTRSRPSLVAAFRASLLPARRMPRQGNPVRMLVSAAPWRATGYLAGYVMAGSVFFAVATAAVLVGIVFSQLTVTVALTIGSVWVVRCCAQVERGRAVLVDAPIPYAYQEVTEPGLVGHLKARCTDPVFYRDCCYLILLHPFLLLLDALTLALWLPLLTGVSLPLWFWAVESRQADGSFADGVRLGRSDGTGPGIWIDTWPAALIASAVFLALAMYASYAVVAAARLHLTVAHALLRPPPDPLAEAKHVLAAPGPLSLTPSRPAAGPTAHGGHRT
ncbi:sensor domain-containing protein [Streptomyces adelaidensis]|uniref:sensor domain-containing protein n=1 Tax=Streptomyces adelaidensis TaxID=2796465 RepID=UPI001906DEE2|nr:sensor domain-containing protein [Streptomyces adelaidensis]